MEQARRSALVAYSEGSASRRDLAAAFGEPVSFGLLLTLLASEGLQLPRFPSDPRSPGRTLLRALLMTSPPDAAR